MGLGNGLGNGWIWRDRYRPGRSASRGNRCPGVSSLKSWPAIQYTVVARAMAAFIRRGSHTDLRLASTTSGIAAHRRRNRLAGTPLGLRSRFGSAKPAYGRGRETRAVASRNNWLRRVCLRMYRKTPVGAAREREGDALLDAWSWRFLATYRKVGGAM